MKHNEKITVTIKYKNDNPTKEELDDLKNTLKNMLYPKDYYIADRGR